MSHLCVSAHTHPPLLSVYSGQSVLTDAEETLSVLPPAFNQLPV